MLGKKGYDSMKICKYKFKGYEEYSTVSEKIFSDLFGSSNDNSYFQLAVNEAVINAAKYSIYGINAAEIEIEIHVTDSDISISIHSVTRPFDVKKYRNQMKILLNDPKVKDLDWGDYTAQTERSRGFWYMLTACDYLYMDINGEEITLCVRKDSLNKQLTTRISQLVPRFLIRENGVIT